MERMHPGNLNAFTRMQSESNLLLTTKQPIKCNYCGDTAASIDEIESHHNFLHSHLPVSYTNLRDEALLSIHKSSANNPPTKETVAFSSSVSSLPRPTSIKEEPPVIRNPFSKNTARKSFPRSLPQRRQIATKSTSGRLQLVRLKQVKEMFEAEKSEDHSEAVPNTTEPADSSRTTSSPSPDTEPEDDSPLNLDEIYASVNLLGSTPMRLSVTQLSALVNLKPKIALKDIKQSTVAALI